MLDAGLDPTVNGKWHAVYDFNDPSETRRNWRLLMQEEQDPMWCPLGGVDRDTVLPGSPVEHNSDDYSIDDSEQSIPAEEEMGTLHKIKVFGCHAWSIISHTVCSVQAFCLGLIFGGIQPSNKMISQR